MGGAAAPVMDTAQWVSAGAVGGEGVVCPVTAGLSADGFRGCRFQAAVRRQLVAGFSCQVRRRRASGRSTSHVTGGYGCFPRRMSRGKQPFVVGRTAAPVLGSRTRTLSAAPHQTGSSLTAITAT